MLEIAPFERQRRGCVEGDRGPGRQRHKMIPKVSVS